MLTLVANIRATDEIELANRFTFRQLAHVCEVHIQDKFMVAMELAKVFTGRKTKSGKSKGLPSSYSWFQYKPRRPGKLRSMQHVDLDGPMEALRPFLGKGKKSPIHSGSESLASGRI